MKGTHVPKNKKLLKVSVDERVPRRRASAGIEWFIRTMKMRRTHQSSSNPQRVLEFLDVFSRAKISVK